MIRRGATRSIDFFFSFFSRPNQKIPKKESDLNCKYPPLGLIPCPPINLEDCPIPPPASAPLVSLQPFGPLSNGARLFCPDFPDFEICPSLSSFLREKSLGSVGVWERVTPRA